jgi:hypothetical protein
MSSVPRALVSVTAHYAAAELRAHVIVENRDAGVLNWRPDDRRWSILQCIQHLALANQFLGASIERALSEGSKVGPESERIKPGMVWRFLLALVEPRVRLKGFAPNVLQPPPSLDAEPTLTAFRESHARLRALAARCHGVDVNRLRFRHPIVRLRMSVGCAFLLLAIHERRHLLQAEEVAALREMQT